MTLRKKTILYLGATFLFSILIFLGVSYDIITKGFLKLEQDHSVDDVHRAANALKEDLAVLNRLTVNWAAGDDSYHFIQDQNSHFMKSHLVDSTFTDLGINFIIYINSAGSVVWKKGMDIQSGEVIFVPSSLLARIDSVIELLDAPDGRAGASGMLTLPGGILMLSAQPILTSTGNGPRRGTLIFARYLNDEAMKDLERRTKLSLELRQVEDPGLPSDFKAANAGFDRENHVQMRLVDDRFMAGYASFPDVFGKPSFIMKVSIPRNIYRQGQLSFRYFLTHLLTIAIAMSVMMLLLIEWVVLARVARLSSSVNKIREKGLFGERINFAGEDELSLLTQNINGMLDSLETRSEEKYRDLFENARDAIFIVDKDLNYVDLNKRAEEIFGFSRDEFLSMSIPDLLPPDQLSRSMETLSILQEQGAYEGFVGKMFTKSGEYLDIEVSSSAIYGNDGEFIGSRDIVRDITARKQAEKALLASEKRFRQVFEENPDPVLIIEGAGDRIVEANRAACELFSFSPGDVGDGSLRNLIGEQEGKKWASVLLKMGRRGTSATIDRLNLRRQGEGDTALSVQIRKIQLGYKQMLYCSFQDVTEKIELDERWRLSLEKIIQMEKMAFLGTMVSGFAHDINNPNQLIRGNVPLIEKVWNSSTDVLVEHAGKAGNFMLGGLPFSEIREKMPLVIKDIKTGSDRIADIVKNLLNYAKGDESAYSENVRINDVVESSTMLLKHKIRMKTENFSMVLGKNIPEFTGNRLQLEQVVINLLTNALDSLPHHKAGVIVRTEHDESSGKVIVRITDQGMGISEKHLSSIKKPFFTTKGGAGGTGLGLAITDSFVRAHKGNLEFDSKLGEGTTVMLTFPLTGPLALAKGEERDI